MTRILALAFAALCCGLSIAHAQTRDETVMYVLLGAESGDRARNVEKKTAFVGPIKRIDRKTMEVELKQGEEVDTYRVTEDPECVFELVVPALVSKPGQHDKWEKSTGKIQSRFL